MTIPPGARVIDSFTISLVGSPWEVAQVIERYRAALMLDGLETASCPLSAFPEKNVCLNRFTWPILRKLKGEERTVGVNLYSDNPLVVANELTINAELVIDGLLITRSE